ncbi:hypothetical protein BGZ60DRAFT_414613 [Tricladium varicosporioides]|nr:hypothetical protein BGZ60DRAFT_414613 [Hymenoscyphus varicosporioides]
MSENYSPDHGAEPRSPWDIAFLSQRDLGLRIPINYVTSPSVSFSAACFPHQRYEDDDSGDCLSNLLAVGFRRFEIDLYWDQGRSLWSFCPVEIPTSISQLLTSAAVTKSSILTSQSLATVTATPNSSGGSTLEARQATGTVPVTTTSLSSTSSNGSPGSTVSPTFLVPALASNGTETPLGTELPSISSLPPNSPNRPAIAIGPYVCTTTINLSTFTSQLLNYIQRTENTLQANLIYVYFNVHAAASDANPLSSAPTPTNLPSPPNLLGSLFASNFSEFIYSPSNLRSDRINLNASWYTVAERYRPTEDYYKTSLNEYNVVSTEDGWPSESFVEFSKSKRLMLSWANVDPQMKGYDFVADEGAIFEQGYIRNILTNVTATLSGQLNSGCFLRDSTEGLFQVNSSWAQDTTLQGFNYPTSPSADIIPLMNLTTNTTNCGISPFLNVTLLNSTARENYRHYQNFSYSTIWSWAPNEPRNYTSSDASSESLFRCATSNLNLGGHWVVADCSQKYYAACRANKQPYNWTITGYPISYSYARQACPDSYSFAAPRTALENSYLTQAMRLSRRDYDGHGAWVDFNDLDTRSCWVTGGPNATCPYDESLSQADDLKRRVILVCLNTFLIFLIF